MSLYRQRLIISWDTSICLFLRKNEIIWIQKFPTSTRGRLKEKLVNFRRILHKITL